VRSTSGTLFGIVSAALTAGRSFMRASHSQDLGVAF
jgi:hypothetical protein